MADRELAIKVLAQDYATGVLRNIGREVSGLDRTIGRGMANAGRNIERGLLIGATAAAGGIAIAVREAGNFEASLNTINTVARLTPEALGEVGEGMRKLARDTGADLDDLTTGYYDLVSAGIAASQAQKVLTSANTLAIGGLATTAEGVDLLTTALNSYGVSADKQGAESERFADIFAKAIERGKVTAAELAQSFAQIGPLAAANGVEVEELAAAYAQLTAKGVPAGEAATQMTSALVALMRRTGDLEKLEEATGKSYLGIAGREGLVVALQQLREDGEAAGVPLIDLLGRIEGLNFVTNTTGDALDGYNQHLEAMADAEGTAAEQMSERQKGLNYQLQRLKANARDAAIEIGSALAPELADLASEAVDFLLAHRSDIKGFARDLAGGLREGVAYLKEIDWNAVMGTLSTVAGVGKTLLDAFLGAPGWVQTAVLTGWGLNKLTGGMVGDIFGQLASGLVRGILGINAGVVNVRGAVVNAPGGGVPGTPTGGRPGTGKIPWLGVASAVTLPLMLTSSEYRGTEEQRQASDRRRVASGELTQAEFDRFWGQTLRRYASGGSGTGTSDWAQGLSGVTKGSGTSDWARGLTKPPPAVLPDTAMQPVTAAIAKLPDTAILRGIGSGITSTVDRAVGRVANIGERQQAMLGEQARRIQSVEGAIGREGGRQAGSLAEQTRRLWSIEGIEAGAARSAAITAGKDFSATVQLTTQTTVNLDGRTVASQTLYRLAAAGVDPAFRAPI